MPFKKERFDVNVFIASSGELKNERIEAVLILYELNKLFGMLHFNVIEFEYDTSSGNSLGYTRIQDNINTLLDQSDIVLVLFYSKVGKFTREEYLRAKQNSKKVFLYFKDGFTPTGIKELEMYREVLSLKEEVEEESQIRYQKYLDLIEYRSRLYTDFNRYLTELFPDKISNSDKEQFLPKYSRGLLYLFDSKSGMSGKYFFGEPGRDYKNGKPVSEYGLGKLKFEDGIMIIERKNIEGTYKILLSTYFYEGIAKPYIQKIEKQDGDLVKFGVSFDASISGDKHTLWIIFKGMDSGKFLNDNKLNGKIKVEISSHVWEKFEVSYWVKLTEDCQIKFEDEITVLTSDNFLKIRNLVITAEF
jgi:hypothetical protein